KPRRSRRPHLPFGANGLWLGPLPAVPECRCFGNDLQVPGTDDIAAVEVENAGFAVVQDLASLDLLGRGADAAALAVESGHAFGAAFEDDRVLGLVELDRVGVAEELLGAEGDLALGVHDLRGLVVGQLGGVHGQQIAAEVEAVLGGLARVDRGVGVIGWIVVNFDVVVELGVAGVVLAVGEHAAFEVDEGAFEFLLGGLGRAGHGGLLAAEVGIGIAVAEDGDASGSGGDDRALLVIHDELAGFEAVVVEEVALVVAGLIQDVDLAIADQLFDLGVAAALLAFLEGDGAIEHDLHVLALELGVFLVRLDAAVEVGVLAVEEHVLVPVDDEACARLGGLAAVEGGIAGHVHGAGALDL